MERCQGGAPRLVAEGKAYEDEGAIRFRMPDEGVTAWDDAILGRIEFPNEKLEDIVIVRSDGRPTYNFASPFEDAEDGITHVIRGHDHISNTPKQIQILRRSEPSIPVYGHVPDVHGSDGKKLSKRHGAQSRSRSSAPPGYVPDALVNFLALLGWSYDDRTTIMSRDELIERFTLERVGASPATLDYEKLDWMNGVYLRAMSERGVRRRARRLPARAGARLGRGRSCAECGAARPGEDRAARAVRRLRRLPVRSRRARPCAARRRRPRSSRRRARRSRRSSRSTSSRSRRRLRALAERLGLKPRRRVPADSHRRDRLEGLARPLREHRAARARGDARASRAARFAAASLKPWSEPRLPASQRGEASPEGPRPARARPSDAPTTNAASAAEYARAR